MIIAARPPHPIPPSERTLWMTPWNNELIHLLYILDTIIKVNQFRIMPGRSEQSKRNLKPSAEGCLKLSGYFKISSLQYK